MLRTITKSSPATLTSVSSLKCLKKQTSGSSDYLLGKGGKMGAERKRQKPIYRNPEKACRFLLTAVLTTILVLSMADVPATQAVTSIALITDPQTFGTYGGQQFKDRLVSNGYTVTTLTHSEMSTFNFSLVKAAVVLWDSRHTSQPKDYSTMISAGIGIVFMSADVAKAGLLR